MSVLDTLLSQLGELAGREKLQSTWTSNKSLTTKSLGVALGWISSGHVVEEIDYGRTAGLIGRMFDGSNHLYMLDANTQHMGKVARLLGDTWHLFAHAPQSLPPSNSLSVHAASFMLRAGFALRKGHVEVRYHEGLFISSNWTNADFSAVKQVTPYTLHEHLVPDMYFDISRPYATHPGQVRSQIVANARQWAMAGNTYVETEVKRLSTLARDRAKKGPL